MGCKIIDRKSGTRDLIRALKNNEAIGMTADQGGRKGIQIKLFGQEASLPTGAIKLALKYDAAIIPGYYTRIKGPYIKTILEPAFKIKKTGDLEKDVRDNLAELAKIFEKYITRYPKDYLWSYKIWKYSTSRRILVLDDGKVGHLRQSQAIAKTIEELLNARGIHAKGIHAQTEMLGIEFRNKFCKSFLLFSSGLSGRYHCQGCLWCLRNCLKLDIYKTLTSLKPDYVVSTGSSLAAINYILSRENAAKSIVNLRPSILSTKRFDLVVMPRHDEPPKRKNIVVTEGALNIIDRDYLKGEGLSLSSVFNLQPQLSANYLGLLIGGDTKNFSLTVEAVSEVIKQIKMASETLRAQILATTSRRTGAKVEKVVKDALGTFPGCAALIIANEKNIPSAVGGILGLSAILIVSPESISMISEAVTSERYVIVFNSGGLDEKHGRFLDYFSRNNYIYLVEPRDISKTIENIWRSAPQINYLKDNLLVKRAIERLV
jgi:mitochondrial fission protein ELM1